VLGFFPKHLRIFHVEGSDIPSAFSKHNVPIMVL